MSTARPKHDNTGEGVSKLAKTKHMNYVFGADTKAFQKKMKTMQKSFKTVKARVLSLKTAMVALAGTAGIGKLTSAMIKSSSEAKKWQAQLSKATDSTTELGETWEWIQELGRTPPFDEATLTKAFVTLSNASGDAAADVRDDIEKNR